MGTPLPMPSGAKLRASLVRIDHIEAWAPKLYVLQALPGYYNVVRQAELSLCRDGGVIYSETKSVGLRLFQRKTWIGKVEDLGKPLPVSIGFQLAKTLRMHGRVRDTSFMARIDGKPMIVCFTGRKREVELKGLVSLVHLIPEVGHLIEGAEVVAGRAVNLGATGRAAEAAKLWRSVLDTTMDPATLPLLFGDPH